MADKGQDPLSLLLPVLLSRTGEAGEKGRLSGAKILPRKLLPLPDKVLLQECMPAAEAG